MALTLEEYIKQSYQRPNRIVLKSLGASEELIQYLLYTPWNTNLNVFNSYINKNSWWAFAESKFGSLTIYSNGTIQSDGMVTSKTFEEWNQLFTTPENYRVFLKRWSDGRIFELSWIIEEEIGYWEADGFDEKRMGYHAEIQRDSYSQDEIIMNASVEGDELMPCSIEVEIRG